MCGCIFCSKITDEQKLFTSNHFFAVYDIDPIQEGHLLLIHREHRLTHDELSLDEIIELFNLQRAIINSFKLENIDGVTIVQNSGAVMDDGTHFHVHFIPRAKEDLFWETVNPVQISFNKEAFKNRLKECNLQ